MKRNVPYGEKSESSIHSLIHSFIPVFVKFQVCQAVGIQCQSSESMLSNKERNLTTITIQNEYVIKFPLFDSLHASSQRLPRLRPQLSSFLEAPGHSSPVRHSCCHHSSPGKRSLPCGTAWAASGAMVGHTTTPHLYYPTPFSSSRIFLQPSSAYHL